MRALVTGATGGLGLNLVERLVSDGHQVDGTGRNYAIGKQVSDMGAVFTPARLEDGDALRKLCHNIDVVFHCAGFSSPWGQRDDFVTANIVGTTNIVSACLEAGVRRLVHVSTPSIYFNFKDRFDVSETADLPDKFVNDYAATKRDAENIVMQAATQGLEVIILRPRGIFGPHDTALFPRLIKVAKRGRIPLFDGGNAIIDVTYVENVVDAMVLASGAPVDVTGQAYNITNAEPISVRKLLEKTFKALQLDVSFLTLPYRPALVVAGAMEVIAGLLPNRPEPPLTRYSVGVLSKSQTLDISAAKECLGYQPQVSIEDGIERFAAWWRMQQ